jgi:hypothetical protein
MRDEIGAGVGVKGLMNAMANETDAGEKLEGKSYFLDTVFFAKAFEASL